MSLLLVGGDGYGGPALAVIKRGYFGGLNGGFFRGEWGGGM